MENKKQRKLFIACLIMLSILIAHGGLLMLALLCGVMPIYLIFNEDFRIVGDEEEESEEEES